MGTIAVKNLGKAYRQYGSRWQRLAEWVIPFSRVRHTLKWVLQDISFTLAPGHAVGIIGINGAGKSTLLKLITGTTQPTTGSVNVSGRVAALLELGMGFHPDFTGRQNTYMAGQLIGLSADEITALMPEIEAFAEIGDYLDMPVRVYSSGMQMRLAFSIATCKRPDVLIVDEALSVGDAYFQHKSFDRIRQFREQGTTLLIVSHDKAAIQSICDRAILLNGGRVALEGDPEAVMDYYNALLADSEHAQVSQQQTPDGRIQTISGTGEAGVEEVGLYNTEGERVELVRVGEMLELRVKVVVRRPIPSLVLGYGIKDRLGQVMYGTNTWHTGQAIANPAAGDRYVFSLRFPANFGVGSYSIQTALVDRDTHLSSNYEWRDLAAVFNVINVDRCAFAGCLWNEPTISIEKQ
ncbi:Lipopolysaccharide transport system ATP-binding protein [Thauera humireducens]|uniref:ABC transporter ATP-binding protein n=1 Tax=Thauera humireducens TaxID=1134435 RepID=UPI002467ABC5|nr:ABC transporter ATP-binding protein [Thauera humireducens]CAH1746778.1 Lipopolysaccharide transport system ATP-binding protein [Thauera humireducens]